MLVWAGCRYVAESAFIDYQEVEPDFASFVTSNLAPDTFIRADKKDELPLIIPAEFVTGGVIRRKNSNVLAIHMAVLDLDAGSAAEQQRVLGIAKQYGHFVHTSFSHDPAGQHKHRAYVKLSRPVNVTEWRAFFPRMLAHFTAKGIADEKCKDPCHMYFVPGGDFSKYVAYGSDGPGLDVDAVLATTLPEGYVEPEVEGCDEVLDEEERAPIGEGLKDLWNARLSNLVDAIEAREFPGPIYDLKVHQVFGLARGCPHILSPERLRNSIIRALDRRYRKAVGSEADMVPVYREKSIEQIEKAIESGMNQPWWPPKVNEIVARPLTEYGLAERLVDAHADDIRWEPTWKSWLGWNGKYWNLEAGIEVVKRRMYQTTRTIPKEIDAFTEEYWQAKMHYNAVAGDDNVSDSVKALAEFKVKALEKQIDALQSFALKCETSAKESNALTIASHDPKVITDYRAFNKQPWLLNFKNGTVDLRTGTLRPHRREDFLTRTVPYNFDPEATCPRFDFFMKQFMSGNQRMIDFLWRAMGYTATGSTAEQKIFILHGDGANGKSTFLNVMLKLFGESDNGYGMAVNSENLLSSRGSNKHETWRMSLASVRLVSAQEVDEGRSFSESLIKELTGSDPITGRKLYQNNWTFVPEFAAWLAVNHLPHVRGTDEGIWRRLCVIECSASFKDNPTRDLLDILVQEADGIWARIVREAKAWVKDGLVMPREIIAANAIYRQEQDPLKDFIEKYCVVESDAVTPRGTIWAAHEDYCTEYKNRVFHERKRFYAALEKQFGTKKVRGERYFTGLRVKTPKERIEASPKAILARAYKDEDKPN